MENHLEIWKDIAGYEGYYQVSNYGNVKSLDRIVQSKQMQKSIKGKVLKKSLMKIGYCSVNLCIKGKCRQSLIHRMVGMAFIPNPENKKEINHKNGIRHDNYYENLEWVTSRENQLHKYRVLKIDHSRPNLGRYGALHNNAVAVSQYSLEGEHIADFGAVIEAARYCGSNNGSSIVRVCKGVSKTYKGYIWKYKTN